MNPSFFARLHQCWTILRGINTRTEKTPVGSSLAVPNWDTIAVPPLVSTVTTKTQRSAIDQAKEIILDAILRIAIASKYQRPRPNSVVVTHLYPQSSDSYPNVGLQEAMQRLNETTERLRIATNRLRAENARTLQFLSERQNQIKP